jgi:hypothetical protein
MALAKWKAEQDIFQTTPGAAYMPGVGGGEGGVWQPGQIDEWGRKVLPPGQSYAMGPGLFPTTSPTRKASAVSPAVEAMKRRNKLTVAGYPFIT